MTVSHHDGSPLDRYRLLLGRLDMYAEVVMKSGGRRSIDTKTIKMSSAHEGVFEVKMYLRTELGKFKSFKFIEYITNEYKLISVLFIG